MTNVTDNRSRADYGSKLQSHDGNGNLETDQYMGSPNLGTTKKSRK